MASAVCAPDWLLTGALLSQFGKRHDEAREPYRQFVVARLGGESIWKNQRQRIYLGADGFVRLTQEKIDTAGDERSIPCIQRRAPARSFDEIFRDGNGRTEAIATAYSHGACSYRQVAKHQGLHASQVSEG
jgi:putative transposase